MHETFLVYELRLGTSSSLILQSWSMFVVLPGNVPGLVSFSCWGLSSDAGTTFDLTYSSAKMADQYLTR